MKLHSIQWNNHGERLACLDFKFVGAGVRGFQVYYGVGFGDDSADTVRALRDMANMIENSDAELRAAIRSAANE